MSSFQPSSNSLRILGTIFCIVGLLLIASIIPPASGGGLSNPEENQTSDPQRVNASENERELNFLNPGQQPSSGGSLDTPKVIQITGSLSTGNLSSRPHFIVQSNHPTYWRTGAYDRYTGKGWERTGTTHSLENPISVSKNHQVISQRYRLFRPATSLPVAWRPSRIEGQSTDTLALTEELGIRASRTLPPNTTYAVQSSVISAPPEELRNAPDTYPEAIQERYTGLPEDTPSRIGEFTEDLVADDQSAYQKAVTIENWLESNKRYSLTVDRDGGGNVADQFIFEMDRGYCQYFATSMVAMLRTQDIPARYTVGYSTGERVEENQYLVRGMNAHAWVEVFFPNVGWVRFDPTPAAPRLAAERDALKRGSNESSSLQSDKLDNSTFESNDSLPSQVSGLDGSRNNTTQKNSANAESSPSTTSSKSIEQNGIQILIHEPVVPGTSVTATISKSGEPISNARVSFNGHAIGTTNESGQVRGPVPFEKRLLIQVTLPANQSESRVRDVPNPRIRRTLDRLELPSGKTLVQPSSGQQETVVNQSFPVETDINITQIGATHPGKRLVIQGEIQNKPIRFASVSIDGSTVGRTNSSGKITTRIPDANTNTITIRMRRGAATGNLTLVLYRPIEVLIRGAPIPGKSLTIKAVNNGSSIPEALVTLNGSVAGRTNQTGELSLTVPYNDPISVVVKKENSRGQRLIDVADLNMTIQGKDLPLLLPGLPALVKISVHGNPVADVEVQHQTARVRTDESGKAVLKLPFSNSATLQARRGGIELSKQVSGLFLNLWTVLLGLTGVIAIIVSVGRLGIGTTFLLVRRHSHSLVTKLVTIGQTLHRSGYRAWTSLLNRLAQDRVAVEKLGARFFELVLYLENPNRFLRFPSRLSDLFQTMPFNSTTGSDSENPSRTQFNRPPDSGTFGAEAYHSRKLIRSAWDEMVADVRIPHRQSKTPEELTRIAIQNGVPPSAAWTVKNAFIEVEYGGFSPEERSAQVRTAVSEIRELRSASSQSLES